MDDDAVVIVPDAQVAARTGAGVVLQTGLPTSTHIATPRNQVGDKVSVKGDKILKIQFPSYQCG